MNKKVYIAGPMRGIKEYNFPAFDEASKRWLAAGWIPFSPAAVDRALHVDGSTELTRNLVYRVMALDVQLVFHSDVIALLPGWERSAGASVELSLAQFLGMPTYDANTMELINPVKIPWSLVAERMC